jgi:DNA helicase-2/ATP-dependent DNA helicase PcrA
LSNDLSKLGNIPNLFYRILQFINNLNNPKTILANLINKKIYSQMTIAELKKLVAILKDIKGVSLGEYVKDIFEKYENSGSAYYKQVIRELINIESYSHQHVTNYLLDELFLNIGSARIEDFKLKLLELFNENLVVKAAEKETLELKHQLEQLTGNQSLSYLDTEEVNNFKNKIHKLLNSQKISGISDKDIDPFRSKVDKLFEDEIFSIVDIDEAEEAKKKLDLLLSIKLDQWAIWHKFINDEQEIDTVYYTYHGTKGAEFDNVIIIMENDFGRLSPDKFSSFFEHYANPIPLDEKETAQLYNTRNLLYVSCSRAIKNLRILYLDDISEFKKGIENIFGTISPYQPGEISA